MFKRALTIKSYKSKENADYGRFCFATENISASKPSKNQNQHYLLLAKYVNVGYYLIAPLLIGVFFGVGIDKILHTKPLFTLIFLGLAVLSTFYNLAKIIREI